MTWLPDDAHAAVICPETLRLGEILWYLLKAEQDLRNASFTTDAKGVQQRTPFGDEVGRDAIHWWVFKKESDLNRLEARTNQALEAADRLKKASATLRRHRAESYDALLAALRDFAVRHAADVLALHGYVTWLWGLEMLAPSILFTYRVWGSTRRDDRWADLTAQSLESETPTMLRHLTEMALGLRNRFIYAFDHAIFEIGAEAYERNPEAEGSLEVDPEQLAAYASPEVLGEFAVFFEWLRASLRNVVVDIHACVAQRELLHSDAFWRQFILTAVHSRKTETLHWDFKETLALWKAKGEARDKAKLTLAEDAASFANASGGAIIVGVTDDRKIVGIKGDCESGLKFARDVLAERLDYPRDIVVFHEVAVPGGSGEDAMCLVVAVARSMEVVAVNDGEGHFSYPVRRETGLSRETPHKIDDAKTHLKSDSFDFMERLQQFVREHAN